MPNAQAGTLQLPYPTLGVWQKRLESGSVVALVAEVDGLLVGQLSLHMEPNPRRKHVACIGMGVRDDWAGKGVGSALLGPRWRWPTTGSTCNASSSPSTPTIRGTGALSQVRFRRGGAGPWLRLSSGEYVDALYMARIRP